MGEPILRIDELQKLCRIGWRLSVFEQNAKSVAVSTVRTYYAELLFAKIIQNAHSILRLLHAAHGDSEKPLPPDVASIASLSRHLIEAHNVLQYICMDKVSKTEFEFRLYLMGLHQARDMRLLLDEFGFDARDRMHDTVNMIKVASVAQLEENALYQGLDDKTKRNLLKGTKAYRWEPNRRIQNRPISQQLESAIYKFLSASVHSFPLGLQFYYLLRVPKTAGGDTGSHLDAIGLLFISVEVAVLYLASAIRCYTRLRHKHARLVSPEEKAFLKNVAQKNLIEEWIEYRRRYDAKHRWW